MMSRTAIRKRIFVVGVPRSGTTLLQGLLAAHSETTSFTESHFFARHFSLLPGISSAILTRDPEPRVHEFLDENNEPSVDAARWFSAKEHWSRRKRLLLPVYSRTAALQLLRTLDQLTLRRGVPNWIEKTPRHLRYAPFLERITHGGSRPHFVHVIRDGLEVVASLHEASQRWERPYDLETCVRRWNRDVAFSLSRIAAPRDHFVFYEELTSRPESVLGQLCKELGLAWEPDILERYGGTTDRLVTRQEPWKADVGRPIHQSARSEQTLSAEQRDRVRQWLRPDLHRRLRDGVQPPQNLSANVD